MRSNMSVRRDPFAEFDSLVRRAFAPVEGVDTSFSPAVEAHRDGDDAVVRLELPGLDVDRDVTVEVLGRDLVVSGERRDERESDAESGHLREFRYGTFRRTFTLGRPVSPEAVTAAYDAGVLTIRIRDAYAEVTGQRIAITTPASEAGSTPEVVLGESEEPTA